MDGYQRYVTVRDNAISGVIVIQVTRFNLNFFSIDWNFQEFFQIFLGEPRFFITDTGDIFGVNLT
jgi:hypothetical protein